MSTLHLKWIESLGTIPKCENCAQKSKELYTSIDLNWIKDTTLFNKKLIQKLADIYNNRSQDKNHYVSSGAVKNARITNELVYKEYQYPNENYGLLGLVRYWNVIEYFFPYKHLMDQDWDAVLEEMIPRFRTIPNKEEYQKLLQELVAKLDDSHAWIRFRKNDVKYVPFKVSYINEKLVVSKFYNKEIAQENQLKLGDIVLKINGIDLISEVKKKVKYNAGSNPDSRFIKSSSKVLHGDEQEVRLTIERDGKVLKLKVKRYNFETFGFRSNAGTPYKVIENSIGYIDATRADGKQLLKAFKSFKKMKGIVIDLRGYPNAGFIPLTRYLNSEKKVFAKSYSPDFKHPGNFTLRKEFYTSRHKKPFLGKVVLLVNDETYSRAELYAMAVQAGDNIVTVGNQTVGADGDLVRFEYLEGYLTSMSGNAIVYPDGSNSQRKGVKIDVEVKPTIAGLKAGKDELLEKAIEIIQQ